MTTDPAPTGFDLLDGAVMARLEAATDGEVLRALSDRLQAAGHVTETFADAVRAREERHPTGLPTAIPTAIPHTDPEHVLNPGLALATLARPVAFGEMGRTDGTRVDVRLVVMLVLADPHSQLAALQHLIARLQDADAVRELLAAADDTDLRRRVERWLGG